MGEADDRDLEGTPPEPEAEPEQGFVRELAQFFIVPSLIVLLCVGVFIMFGLISSESKGVRDFLQEIRSSRGTDRWQAAFEMSRAIAQQPALRADEGLVREISGVIGDEGRDDPKVRKYLIIALENLGNRSAGPALIAALADPDPEVRLQAARALGAIGGIDGSAGPLIALLSDEDAGIRKVAIYALGRTRDPVAIPALRPKLEDTSEDIRWNAALALAVLGDGSGRTVIEQMIDRRHLDTIDGITEEQKVGAIINGIQAVYLLHDRSFLQAVEELSRKDPSLKVREIAIKVLESLGNA
ncbi:MAG TPA: HEAT repeat domain-containing protein [Patescibacteria group bacterium]|nr:HEAT repeat domain-containing protein [Patescibacteria group bacterium]